MRKLEENEKRTLNALIEMYDSNKVNGYIKGGVSGVATKFKASYVSVLAKELIKHNFVEVVASKTGGRESKWIGKVRPTYLTVYKILESMEGEIQLIREKARKKESAKYKRTLIDSSMNKKAPEFTKRDDFINMFDNIVSENKEVNLKTIELENNLIKANKDKEKLNLIISEYKEKHLESYTTSFLWGLIKIKTKLNYSK